MRQRIQWVFACLTVVMAAVVILEAQLWVSGASSVSTSGTVSITNSGAAALDVTGGINAGSGNVGIVGTDGRVPAISSTYFASLAGTNITGIPHLADTTYTYTGASLTIAPNTSDASDTSFLSLLGGGASGTNRGASLVILGNDHVTFPGQVRLAAGDAGTIGLFGTVATTGRYNSATAQPGFLAYNTANDSGLSSGATVDFDTEVYDTGSDFALDTFTAPVTGQYLLCAGAIILPSTTATIGMQLETTQGVYKLGQQGATTTSTATPGNCIHVPMSASDTALVTLLTDTGTMTVLGIDGVGRRLTWFSGRLVP